MKIMNKSTIALCQLKQKENSEPTAGMRNVSPAFINTFVIRLLCLFL